MESPIYETTETNKQGLTDPKYPSGVENSTTGYRGGDGMKVDHITVDDAMGETAAPKNDPSTWSAGK